MTRIAYYLLLVGSIAIPAMGVPAPKPTKKDLVKAELMKLDGTWKPVFCQREGVESDAKQLAAMNVLTFKGFNISQGDKVIAKISDIDPTSSPKTIDYEADSPVEAYRTQSGIYILADDTFIECVSVGGKDRPKEFAAKEGSGYTLLKFKRVKE